MVDGSTRNCPAPGFASRHRYQLCENSDKKLSFAQAKNMSKARMPVSSRHERDEYEPGITRVLAEPGDVYELARLG